MLQSDSTRIEALSVVDQLGHIFRANVLLAADTGDVKYSRRARLADALRLWLEARDEVVNDGV